MAMAKPIISTNVPVCVLRTGRSDIPEIMDSCGWIVEPENPKQLAKTIKYVFDHPVEAKEQGLKAREKCVKEYSWDVMKEKLIPIFEKYKTD